MIGIYFSGTGNSKHLLNTDIMKIEVENKVDFLEVYNE